MSLNIEKKVIFKVGPQSITVQENDKLEIKLNDVQQLGGVNGVSIPSNGTLTIQIEGNFEG